MISRHTRACKIIFSRVANFTYTRETSKFSYVNFCDITNEKKRRITSVILSQNFDSSSSRYGFSNDEAFPTQFREQHGDRRDFYEFRRNIINHRVIRFTTICVWSTNNNTILTKGNGKYQFAATYIIPSHQYYETAKQRVNGKLLVCESIIPLLS